MGWNTVTVRKPHALLDNLADDARFYFVHSYHIRCNDEKDVLASSHYGIEFTACVSRDNITGVQFHPEKSLRWGMEVFRRFAGARAVAGVH
jgi:glutamine amidotransferase